MKVALIGFNDLQYMPYISKYISVLDDMSIRYDIICWDREDTNNTNPYNSENFYRFKTTTPPRFTKLRKLPGIVAYRRYVRDLLQKGKYDELILLATQSAVIIADILIRKYQGRFILDIRDYWYESFMPLRLIEARLAQTAGLCVLSSRGFLRWLPKADWVVSHNVHIDVLTAWMNTNHQPEPLFNGESIVLNFIGQLRYEAEIKHIIDQLGGCEGYIVNYHGSSALMKDISAYAKSKGFSNVFFHGRYAHADRFDLYKNCDFVLSNYNSSLLGEKTALNNKLYEAVLSLRPIVVSKGTYLEELVVQNGLGFAIDASQEDICQRIQEYKENFDALQFYNRCSHFIQLVLEEDKAFVARVTNHLEYHA